MENQDRITELAVNAQQGSQDSFNELYRLTRDRAYFVALTITHNEQDALDIIQDSYLKAWQSIGSLQKPEQFSAWIRRITGNTAKDYIKHHSPLLFLGSEDGTDDLFDLQEERNSDYIPDAAMDTAETRRLIMEIVDGLPEDQRLCVLMYYYEDMGLPEIAAALDVPQSTVTSRLYLARKKISRGVEDLERKGTKLYSAAPVPLLIWLLRNVAGETSVKLPPVILGSATAAGAAATGGMIAGIALPKLIAGIAAVAIIGGGTVAGITATKHRDAPPAITAPPAQTTTLDATNAPFALPVSDLLLALSGTPGNRLADAPAAVQSVSTPATETPARAATFTQMAMSPTTEVQPARNTTDTFSTAAPVATTKYVYTVPTTTARATTGTTRASTSTSTTTTSTTSASAATRTTQAPIAKTLIPDPGLEAAIRAAINKPTGELTKTDLENVSILDAGGYNICSLEGIKQCTSLTQFVCYNPDSPTPLIVETADFSGMKSLCFVSIWDCQITNLNVSGCTSLEFLSLISNGLETLNTHGCGALLGLNCDLNNLSSLDVNDCTALQELSCSSNRFTSMDVRSLTNLTSLYCLDNQLTSLKVSGLTKLRTLHCEANNLATLDVRGCTALESVWCYSNNFPSQAAILGLDQLTNLKEIRFAPQN